MNSHGPSKVKFVDGIVQKTFPTSEADRFIKEVEKMRHLALIGSTTKKFKVPHINIVNNLCYTTDYIHGDPVILANQLMELLLTIAADGFHSTMAELWNVMLGKFKTAKTDDREYFDLVNALMMPKHLTLGYSHGDFTFDNILYNENEWYLIDPSWSAVESPIWDLGKILQSTAANWDGIKCTGFVGKKPQWLADLNEKMIEEMLKFFNAEEMLLGLACQLARVSRWCFSDELIRITKNLLKEYIKGNENECINALCGIV